MKILLIGRKKKFLQSFNIKKKFKYLKTLMLKTNIVLALIQCTIFL